MPSARPASSRARSGSSASWTSWPRASRSIRSSSAGATTRTRTRSTDVLSRARTWPSATGAPSRTGPGATRCGLGPTARGSAAWGSPARSGTGAGARRRTRGCASGRTATPSWSRRCRTSERGPGRRWRRSPPRSWGFRSNPTGMRVLTFGIQVAEVAVDVETGEVRVERIAAIHDVGRVINPLGAASQVEGGVIQGLGHTLSEQRLLDPASGEVLTQTLDVYRVPTIADVPEIVVDLLDVPDEHLTNLGAKGLGEPPIVPTAAAVANAIRDATGADVRSLPLNREEVLRALRSARERERVA